MASLHMDRSASRSKVLQVGLHKRCTPEERMASRSWTAGAPSNWLLLFVRNYSSSGTRRLCSSATSPHGHLGFAASLGIGLHFSLSAGNELSQFSQRPIP